MMPCALFLYFSLTIYVSSSRRRIKLGLCQASKSLFAPHSPSQLSMSKVFSAPFRPPSVLIVKYFLLNNPLLNFLSMFFINLSMRSWLIQAMTSSSFSLSSSRTNINKVSTLLTIFLCGQDVVQVLNKVRVWRLNWLSFLRRNQNAEKTSLNYTNFENYHLSI